MIICNKAWLANLAVLVLVEREHRRGGVSDKEIRRR